MTVTKDDFEKIWASTSPLTPYSFSDSQYKEGWNFVGSTPPSRQMWDAFMQNADEKLKYLYQHEDVPLGHEYFTFNPNVPQGSLPLFGGEYSRETYSALWNWVQEQTGYLKTEAEWQQLYTTNAGNVPYYSDGDGSTTFRVPSLKCWIKAANGTVSEVGSYLAAGLPNITGNFVARTTNYQGSWVITNANGAVYSDGNGVNSDTLTQASTQFPSARFGIDASRSSSIYGNSTTVQPPSIVGMWLVKAYGVIVDTGQIDEQQYIDDRFNASKQYTDDEVNDAVTTLNGDISAINTRLGTVLSASGTGTAVTSDNILGSISTHDAGFWLILSFVDLNHGDSGFYNNTIATANHGSRGARNIQTAGGGNINYMLTQLNQNEVVTLKGYQQTAGTIRGQLQMVRLA